MKTEDVELSAAFCTTARPTGPSPYCWNLELGGQFTLDMNSDYMCKCNNCDAILIDRNPQENAPKLPLQGNEEQMEWLEDEDGEFWGCPHCKTDGYLMDLPHR